MRSRVNQQGHVSGQPHLLRSMDRVVPSTRSIWWTQEGQGGAVEMAQSVKSLSCKPRDLNFVPRTCFVFLSAFNLSTSEAELDTSLASLACLMGFKVKIKRWEVPQE